MSDNMELNTLAKEKAEEIIYRQKIQELSSAVTEILKNIPNSLKELRHALELLDKNNEEDRDKIKNLEGKILDLLKLIQDSIQKLFDEAKKQNPEEYKKIIESITDRNNPQSLIIQIENMVKDTQSQISDMNNERSVAFRMIEEFHKQNLRITDLNNSSSLVSLLTDLNNPQSLASKMTENNKKILNKINKGNKIRSTITWLILTITGILTMLLQLGIIGKK